MRMNRSGMTAFVDAAIFITVILMALSVTIHFTGIDQQDGMDADGILEMISSSEVRISDMTDMQDDSLVFLTDMIALYTLTGNEKVESYVKGILDVYSRGRAYMMEVVFEDQNGDEWVRILGECDVPDSGGMRTVPVSTGGSLTVRLWFGS